MITVKIQGGLGNQMFQYAYGRALSLEKKTSLFLDLDHYLREGSRAYGLDNFAIKAKKASFLTKIFSRGREGYWQSESFFKDYADTIRKELSLKNPLPEQAEKLARVMRETDSASVHIRRGDYLLPKHAAIFAVCGKEYYVKALEYIIKKVPNCRFFVFSDDLAWAHELPFPPGTVFIERELGLASHEELVLMSQCKHHIIANSSFSWWGAWLGKIEIDTSAVVVAPKKYYVDETKENPDWTPPTWTRI